MFKKALVGGAAAALALSSAGIAMASGGLAGGQEASGESAAARTLTTNTLACDGGRQKRVYNRIKSSPFVFNEGAAPLVPGAALVVNGPRRGVDTLSIEFSAETQLRGSSAGDTAFDWMGLEVLVNGVPIQPYTAVGDVLAITGSATYDSNAAQFCTKIRPGLNRIVVRTNLHDGNNNNALSGWLDDYTLHVEQSE